MAVNIYNITEIVGTSQTKQVAQPVLTATPQAVAWQNTGLNIGWIATFGVVAIRHGALIAPPAYAAITTLK